MTTRLKTLRRGEVYETYDPYTGELREVIRVVSIKPGRVVVELDATVGVRIQTREHCEGEKK